MEWVGEYYEDQNMNNEYDDNEPLLDGVTVNAAQVSRSATTEDGMAFINRLEGYEAIIIDNKYRLLRNFDWEEIKE